MPRPNQSTTWNSCPSQFNSTKSQAHHLGSANALSKWIKPNKKWAYELGGWISH